PKDIVEETLQGILLVNKDKVKRIGNHNVLARIDAPIEGKVGIVIGGGSGHEPLFTEYIGKGMADASVAGGIFAAPPPDQIFEAIKVADSGNGVILLYNNYTGDVLNFNMAQDMAKDEGIKVETVLVNDEISSAPKNRRQDRRGTTADHILIHIAGAASENGLSLSDLVKLLNSAVYNSRSLGVSLSGATLPETNRPTFTLEEGKMEFGMGLHGEAGIKKVDIDSADNITATILDYLIEDLPYLADDEVVVVINGYGSTTRMEMHIIARKIYSYLQSKHISIYSTEVGEFCTSMEMAGVSITLVKLNNQLKKYYDLKADSPGYIK
ncbi:MAG: dihydroxyacetone kinase subunit DhaK, partial [Clostridiaceae bacterium]|nr:dihydroxyacetone kinase subunit DhaK [Clostridiaceae bacterium]